jgi:hypothetical protein
LSPILVRPVREQLEHDRVIRQLQKDLARRKVEVAINPGAEQNVGLGSGPRKEFPDAVLFSTEKGRRVLGVVEVETGESVNYLEAMAEWGHYSRLKTPLHLYVPMGSVDLARRLAADNHIPVAEFHSYHQIGDLIRFASVHRASGVAPVEPEDDPAPPLARAPSSKKGASRGGPKLKSGSKAQAAAPRRKMPAARATKPSLSASRKSVPVKKGPPKAKLASTKRASRKAARPGAGARRPPAKAVTKHK